MDAGILPVKSPARAKRRLLEGLDAGRHKALVAALLEDALALCRQTDFVAWWAVSDDDAVLDRVQDLGLRSVKDGGEGLNEAVATAIQAISTEGAESVMVVPSDVPLARPEDLRDVSDTGAMSDVVLVPAQDGGTNALFLKPPDILVPAFGPESMKAHAKLAGAMNLRCSILDLPGLAIDLDTLEDARLLLENDTDSGSETVRVLRELLG